MSKKRLWVTRRVSDNTLARARRDYEVILNESDIPPDPEEIVRMSAEVDAILPCHSEHFDAEITPRLDKRLKIIANHSVGTDHCDLQALAQKGIVVTNTPDVLSDATAEIAMLLLLGAARRAPEGDQLVRGGQWNDWGPAFMVGQHVTGKTLGIVGMGRVGQVMAKRARGFDMEIHYYNRNRLPAELEQGAVFHESLETLLPVSQFLSLHCPANPDSINLMNEKTFSMLPMGSIFVNTARGALVDEDALIKALDSGRVAAAGLDCFQLDPGGNPKLSTYNNVFMLPHIGSATRDTRDAMGFRALDNLDAFFSGQEPGDRVA